MLPIVLNPKTARIGLAGAGEGLSCRQLMLCAAGVEAVPVAPDSDLKGLSVLFVAGLEAPEDLARRARAAGILVNVEDRPELCDFHVPAIARRGDLLLTVSTGGRTPGLARRLREWLQAQFGGEWDGRLAELGAARDRWRAAGVPAGEISERTRAIIDQKGWLA
jgi:precorrin-2 dehydrogenase / sirohydrochlorin ferrochelatase